MPPRVHARALPTLLAAVAVVGVLATAVVTHAAGRHVTDSPVGSAPVPAGFPSAATTGVPAGTQLQAYTGPLTITQSDTVISNVLINGCLKIDANLVLVFNSKIVCSLQQPVVLVPGGLTGIVLSHDELDGRAISGVGLEAKNTFATGLNIHGTGDGVHLGYNMTLEDSYVHDLSRGPGIHHDCLQTINGSRAYNVKVTHNTLQDYSAHSNGNSVYHAGSGPIANIALQDNYMDGGQFSIFVDGNSTQKDVVIRGNQFGAHYRFGVLKLGDKATAAVAFDHNTWQKSGQPVTEQNSRR